MAAELQRYQWTTSGMRPDDSEVGAMWYYRGFDTDLVLLRLAAELAQTCNCRFEADGEQTMWCPAHLKLREELQDKGNDELARAMKEMGEQGRINVRLRAEIADLESQLLEVTTRGDR